VVVPPPKKKHATHTHVRFDLCEHLINRYHYKIRIIIQYVTAGPHWGGRVNRVDRGGRVQLGSTQKFSEGEGMNYIINLYVFIKFFN